MAVQVLGTTGTGGPTHLTLARYKRQCLLKPNEILSLSSAKNLPLKGIATMTCGHGLLQRTQNTPHGPVHLDARRKRPE